MVSEHIAEHLHTHTHTGLCRTLSVELMTSFMKNHKTIGPQTAQKIRHAWSLYEDRTVTWWLFYAKQDAEMMIPIVCDVPSEWGSVSFIRSPPNIHFTRSNADDNPPRVMVNRTVEQMIVVYTLNKLLHILARDTLLHTRFRYTFRQILPHKLRPTKSPFR